MTPTVRAAGRAARFASVFAIVVSTAFAPVAGSAGPAGAETPAFVRSAQAGAPAAAPVLPPGVTPHQVEAAGQAIRSGAPLSPEARKALEARPDLKQELPDEIRKKLEGEGEAEKPLAPPDGGKKPAAGETTASAPPYDWRTSVYVGGLFSKRLHEAETRSVSHFGHDLFTPRPGGFAVLENMPVAPDYVVGPGDEIVVKMWGRMEGTQRMTVDRDGKIFFPKIGSLYVAGKTFSEVKSFLKGKVSNIAAVSSDVTMGQMKGIRVSVIGEVVQPGWYNVSSLHTALQALFLAGGVKDIGSLRRIELRRGGRTATSIDLYDFLLKGETRSDIALLGGDTIFVPVVGKLTAIAGEVRRPGIYELKEEKTLLDLVRMAGGFAPTAYKRRVQVERLEGHLARIVLDADAEELEKVPGTFDLSDGDIVRVLPVVLTDINAVTLEGNVARPGRYELKPGMTIGALLPDGTAFLPDTWFDYALLTRVVPPEMRKEVVPVNLRAIVLEKKKEADVPLRAQDKLTVFSRSAFRDAPKVTVSGEVRRPGTFELRKGARVSDLVKAAGDLTKSAYLLQAEIVRLDKDRKSRSIYLDLGKAMSGEEKDDVVLEDEDQLFVRQMPESSDRMQVIVSGEVRFPGTYAVQRGERLSSLIARAGGFTQDAYLKAAQFARVSTQKSQQEAIDKLISDLEIEVAQKSQQIGGALDKEDLEANRDLLAARRSLIEQLRKAKAKGRVVIRIASADRIKGTSADILLEEGDRLEVPRKMNVVNVVGRVYNPTGVVFDPAQDSVGYYLKTVGGPTESADRDHIFLLKADGSVVTSGNAEGGFFLFGERGLMSARVDPGDSIVVPEKLIQTRLMKDVKDITQILYQIAVTAGVLIVVF